MLQHQLTGEPTKSHWLFIISAMNHYGTQFIICYAWFDHHYNAQTAAVYFLLAYSYSNYNKPIRCWLAYGYTMSISAQQFTCASIQLGWLSLCLSLLCKTTMYRIGNRFARSFVSAVNNNKWTFWSHRGSCYPTFMKEAYRPPNSICWSVKALPMANTVVATSGPAKNGHYNRWPL